MAAQQAARTAAITVLGGGITGLSTAWYLAQKLPSTVGVALIEGSPRLGGWVRTDSRQIDGLSVLAEKGPRTLRTGNSREALAVLELVDDLDLRSQVVTASKLSPAARNRYIYYGGELNCMPSGLSSLITGLPPAVRCMPRAIWRDLTTKKNAPDGVDDESIHDFIARRFGQQVDDNLASAVMHGIYASDTKELSARALLYPFWLADRTGNTGVLRGLRRVAKLSRARHARFAARDAEEKAAMARRRASDPEFWDTIAESSMYSFHGGMQTLSDRLLSELVARPNVEVITGQAAKGARVDGDGSVEVSLANGDVIRTQHIVNTLPLPQTKSLFADSPSTALLDETPYASVAVVNVTFAQKKIAPIDGFGYLVPRASAASSRALGVVLDSCALPEQDAGANISRLTVMLGGTRFNELFGSPDTVTTAVLESAALETLRSQLGITAEPADIDATVDKNCIPTYTVGYVSRLQKMHEWVLDRVGGRMSVVGAAYGGPAVPHCVLHARDLVNNSLDLGAIASAAARGSKSAPQNVSGLEEIIKGFV
ncbi:Protoporphyrinogen oxidase [Martensiomyces pterosporus]|nr:Protoporphyrinogen oxidase [Martensiomyces pterosporus]